MAQTRFLHRIVFSIECLLCLVNFSAHADDSTCLLQKETVLSDSRKKLVAESNSISNASSTNTSAVLLSVSKAAAKGDSHKAEIVFALSNSTSAPVRNKIILVMLQALIAPNLLGIDRCYMNQFCLGTIKGVTMGGLGIWAIIDYYVVLVNAIRENNSINDFGFHATFGDDELSAAFFLAVIFAGLYAVSICCSAIVAVIKKHLMKKHSPSYISDTPSGSERLYATSASTPVYRREDGYNIR